MTMPLRLLSRFMAQMDKLDASEALSTAQRVAVGSGRAKHGKAIQSEWIRRAHMTAGPKVEASSRGTLRAMAGTLGVPMARRAARS